MEIILLSKIEKLGNVGSVVKVKNGFARNYLLPQKLAIIKNEENLRFVKERNEQLLKMTKEKQLAAEVIAKKLSKKKFDIKVTASTAGKLYGSVTAQNILAVLPKNYGIKKNQIIMPVDNNHIRYIGEYNINIKLHSEVQAEVIINVIS